MENDWLNLSEAADLLGVHPATVRSWSDRGDLPTQRTPGGHRRFRRVDVEARASTHDRRQLTSAQLVIQNMLGRARLELTEGAFDEETWYAQLDEPAKKELRQIGRRLLNVVVGYLTEPEKAPHYLQEAVYIGQDYERMGRECGLSLAQTTRAYLYFREFLSQSIYDIHEASGSQGPTDWGNMRRRITLLTNKMLLALVEAREQTLHL